MFAAGAFVGVAVAIVILFVFQNYTATSKVESTTATKHRSEITPGESKTISNPAGLANPSSTRAHIARVDNLVFPKDTFSRKLTIGTWVAALSGDQILSWLEQSTEPSWNESSENRNDLQSALLQKLTIIAPDEALAFAWSRDEQQRYTMASIVLLVWAYVDLRGAISRVKEMNEADSMYFLPTILRACGDCNLDRQREIAKELGDEAYAFSNYFRNVSTGTVEDPKKTWYEIISISNAESFQAIVDFALGDVAHDWVAQDGISVLDEIVSSITEDSPNSSTLSRVFNTLAETRPEEIFDYVTRTFENQSLELIQKSNIVYHWARKDPKGVLIKAQSQRASAIQQDLVLNAVRHWANINPVQMLEQLDLIPLRHHNFARSRAIKRLAQTAPTEAAKFVLKERESELRRILATSLVEAWSKHDADAAKDWVINLPSTDSLRTELILPLARAMIDSDPRGAFRLALEQPIDEEGAAPFPAMGFESSILNTIVYQNLELAVELLPQVRDSGNALVFTYSSVGVELIQKGETQRAFNLANQLPAEAQAQYYQSIASNWSMRDPRGLLKAIEDSTSEEIRSKLAFSLSVLNKYTNAYSAKEIADLKKYISEEDRKKL